MNEVVDEVSSNIGTILVTVNKIIRKLYSTEQLGDWEINVNHKVAHKGMLSVYHAHIRDIIWNQVLHFITISHFFSPRLPDPQFHMLYLPTDQQGIPQAQAVTRSQVTVQLMVWLENH